MKPLAADQSKFWWQDASTQASRLTVFPAPVPSGTVMTLPAGAQVELVELADSGLIHRLTVRPMTVLDEGITQVAIPPTVASPSATVGAGPSAAAVEHSDQVFSVPGLPVTFRYPAAWGPPQSENATHRVRGPAGRPGRPIEIIIHVENKRDHPGSSAWRQVIRAQDQLHPASNATRLILIGQQTIVVGHRGAFAFGIPGRSLNRDLLLNADLDQGRMTVPVSLTALVDSDVFSSLAMYSPILRSGCWHSWAVI